MILVLHWLQCKVHQWNNYMSVNDEIKNLQSVVMSSAHPIVCARKFSIT